MLKMLKELIVLGIAFCFGTGIVMARGIFITPGGRANNFGGAYVSIAKDLTAIYWNPAGLARIDKVSVEASYLYLKDNTKSNESLGNAPIPNVLDGDFPIQNVLVGVEPSEYNKKVMETTAQLPFIAGAAKIKDYCTLAIGMYGAGGGGGKWNDTVSAAYNDTINASVDSTMGFGIYNISAARQISPKLSAGIGLDVINMTDKANVAKDVTGPFVPYAIEIDKDASGNAFQVVGGVLYDAMDNVSVGAVVRSGAEIKLSGNATYSQEGLSVINPSDPTLQDFNFPTDYDQKFSYPLTYELGISYSPIIPLTVAFSLMRADYSIMKNDFKYQNQLPGVFDDGNALGKKWKDTTYLRLGSEYEVNNNFSLSLGFQTDPCPFDRNNLTLLDTNQYNLYTTSIGTSYTKNSLRCDISYGIVNSDKPGKNGRTYEYPIKIIRVDVGYTFG